MICVSNNNHFSCVIPPCFIRAIMLQYLSTMPQNNVGFSFLASWCSLLHLQNTCSLMHWLMMWQKLGSEICVKLISVLMPELLRRLICWLITAEDLLTIISPCKDAGFNGILDCRLVLEWSAASLVLNFCVGSCLHLVACVHCLWFCKVAQVWLDRWQG